jgi:hypothetical protein
MKEKGGAVCWKRRFGKKMLKTTTCGKNLHRVLNPMKVVQAFWAKNAQNALLLYFGKRPEKVFY